MADNDTNISTLKRKIETLKEKIRPRDERIGQKNDELVAPKEELARSDQQIISLTSDNKRLKIRSEVKAAYKTELTSFITIKRHTAMFRQPGTALDGEEGKKAAVRLSTQLAHGMRNNVADLLIDNGLELAYASDWIDHLCEVGRDSLACKSCKDEGKLCIVLVDTMAIVLPLSAEPCRGLACLSHCKILLEAEKGGILVD